MRATLVADRYGRATLRRHQRHPRRDPDGRPRGGSGWRRTVGGALAVMGRCCAVLTAMRSRLHPLAMGIFALSARPLLAIFMSETD